MTTCLLLLGGLPAHPADRVRALSALAALLGRKGLSRVTVLQDVHLRSVVVARAEALDGRHP